LNFKEEERKKNGGKSNNLRNKNGEEMSVKHRMIFWNLPDFN
jgi:hypothetical protein